MEISSVPVRNNELAGLGQKARRYFYSHTGETICFVSVLNQEIFFYSTRMISAQAMSFILTDHKKYF